MSTQGQGADSAGAVDALRVDREIPTLRQRVLDKLREAILDFRLKPGQKLVERALCEMLGVSRTSVREALRHLEAEGLVESRPHRGRYVATITPDEARSLYEVRAELEGLAVQLFTCRADNAQVQALAGAVDELEKTYARGQALAMLKAKSRVYDIIFAGCGNAVCAEISRALQARVSYLRGMSLSAPGRTGDSIIEIRRILDAVQARDSAAARKACVEHVASASRVAQHTLASQQS